MAENLASGRNHQVPHLFSWGPPDVPKEFFCKFHLRVSCMSAWCTGNHKKDELDFTGILDFLSWTVFGICVDCLEWTAASAWLDSAAICVCGQVASQPWTNVNFRRSSFTSLVLFVWVYETSWPSNPQWDCWNWSCRQTATSLCRSR